MTRLFFSYYLPWTKAEVTCMCNDLCWNEVNIELKKKGCLNYSPPYVNSWPWIWSYHEPMFSQLFWRLNVCYSKVQLYFANCVTILHRHQQVLISWLSLPMVARLCTYGSWCGRGCLSPWLEVFRIRKCESKGSLCHFKRIGRYCPPLLFNFVIRSSLIPNYSSTATMAYDVS